MNIEKLFKKKERDEKYTSSSRRSVASSIDIFIATFIRVFTAQLLGMTWINKQIVIFQNDFRDMFGTESIKSTPQHLQFVMHHPLVIHLLLFASVIIFVGALYHTILNSSAWQATVGKRLMGIILVNEKDETKLGFWKALAHYSLSIAPFIFILYIIAMQVKTGLSLMQIITGSDINLLLSIIFLLWLQPHLFTKKKTTSYDMICHVVMINGKTAARFPWNKDK